MTEKADIDAAFRAGVGRAIMVVKMYVVPDRVEEGRMIYDETGRVGYWQPQRIIKMNADPADIVTALERLL